MLIEFSVGNYRSFKEKVTFSMVATTLSAKDKKLDRTNLFDVDEDLKLLKSAAIYGANASGKSNLAKALGFMKWFAINSSKETQSTEKINVEHFRLSTETESEPSFFEIVFVLDGQQYRYGFEANRDRVVSEWLFYVPKVRETKLFERENNRFSISKTYKADGIQQRTRDNALFLSVSAQFNVKIAEKILEWLTSKLQIISGLNDKLYFEYTVKCLMENQNKHEIIELIKKLDLGIGEIEVGQTEITVDSFPMKFPDELKELLLKGVKGKATAVNTIHKKFDSEDNYISTELFNLNQEESKGTQKVFALAGPLVDVLKNGKILVVDELDARLHPLISIAIIQLFNSNESNPKQAQLIFMTHDTNLLSNKIFRRDQIWFTEKNRYGATDLYSLAEYKVRNDASFESDYIKGKYGAVPYVGNLDSLTETHV
ncbi:ATP-binding protein [Mastigocoleus sp. MO_188.B34]|uniref:AAA family ATPase n=1 Tax=Mastigocoleus sp. MO_188.B34 TaxID=3036635 RepID=UPI002632F819|nr:ATP-binding protein [Mastigocoleus sp. MO_188.B34]